MKYLGIFLIGFSALISNGLQSQIASKEQLWVEYMQEPQPNYYKVRKAFYEYWGDSIPERSNGYKVFKRWEWRVTRNMLIDGTVIWPQEQLADFLNSGSTPNAGQQQKGVGYGGGGYGAAPCIQGGRWSPVGPIRHPYNQTSQPTGIGRIAGIAFHPKDSNTLYACAPQGGLWKTTDNGKNWKHLFGKGPVVNTIGTNSLLISYNGNDTLYMGTGDRDAGDAPGYGVLASWNGGSSWVSRNSGMGNRRVGRMVMHPKNSAIMLAATDAGIYRTTNSGNSWTLVLSGGAWDIAYKPNDPTVAYAIIGASFYRSTDGGQSWTQITSGLPTSGIQRAMLAVTKADDAYVYMLISNSGSGYYGVYQSTNSGVSFTGMSTTPNILGYSETGSGSGGQAWYDLDIAADPLNKNTIYAFGINIWKSTNGGATWVINGHWVGAGGADDIHADQHSGEFSNSGAKLYAGNDGGIYYTINGGLNWINISSGIQNSQIYRLSQAQTNAFAGAQGYQDNGSSQTQEDDFFTYYGGDGMDCQTDPTDHSYMYGSYVYGVIYRSINKNTNRTIAANGTNGINEGGGWLTPFILQEGNPSRMFAGYTNVWRSDNVKTSGAITWTRITTGFSGSVRQLENSPASPSTLYVINGSGALHRSTNASSGTPTWTNLSSSQPSGLRYVEAHSKYPNTVFACNASNLYRSTNQGATWTSIAVLPSGSGNMNCLFTDSSTKTERIYIGSEKGVFVWDSASNTVHTFNTGFPVWADVTDLDIYHSPKGPSFSKIVASTYGMGVWRSNLFEDGTLAPKADFYAFDSVFVSGGVLRLYENVQQGASALRWKITPYTYSYIEGTDSTSLNPVVRLSGVNLYTVKLIASNCQGSDSLVKKSWIRVYSSSNSPSCKNTTNYQTYNYAVGVLRFSLTDNKSETGTYFDDGEYFDRSADKVFRLLPGTSYTATIKTGLYNPEYVRLYIDYDNNGKFENYKGEVSALSASVLGDRNISFTTPVNLKPNKGVRIRVLGDFYSLDTNACRNLGYGQGEDYTLIYDKPLPNFKVSKTSACINESIVFTDSTDGLADQWEWDFGSGASPSTAVGRGPHNVIYSSSGNKNVRLRINGKDSIRKNNFVRIDPAPSPLALLKSGNLSGCEGRNITLAVRSSNGVPFSVQWLKNGNVISGKIDTVLNLTNLSINDAGTYSAQLTNGGCKVTSNALSLQVYPKPNVDFSVNSAIQCFRYHRFAFTANSVIASGSISNYNWSFGDGLSTNTINPSHQYGSSASYNVKLVNVSNQGCKDSISKTVTVNPNAKLSIAVNDSDQCLSGNSFVLSNNSTINTGTLTWYWQFGDGATSTVKSPTKSYLARGIYAVNLVSTSNMACKDTISKTVQVYSNPQAQFGILSNAQCLKNNAFSFTNFTVNTDGTTSYKWNFGDGNQSALKDPVHSYLTPGKPVVKLVAISSFGCADSISKTMDVFDQAKLNILINDSDQCQSGNLFVFTNNSVVASGTLSYQWTFGDNTSSTQKSPQKSYLFQGIYPIALHTITNNGCKDTLTTQIRVYAQPAVDFVVNSEVQCLRGNEFRFTNQSAVSDASFTSQWKFLDGTSSLSLNAVHSYKNAGEYMARLVVKSGFGCTDSISKKMTVLATPKVDFTVNDSDQCLSGNRFDFNNLSSINSGTINTTQWYFGDGNQETVTSPSHVYSNHGIYKVQMVVLSNNQCRDTSSKYVRVFAQPKATFETLPNAEVCYNFHVFEYNNQSSIAEGTLSATWDLGDGAGDVGDKSKHSYATPGSYTVKLNVVSNYGCTDNTSKVVVIYPSPLVAFTPSKLIFCEGDVVDFSNGSVISSGNLSHNWDFGQGLNSNAFSPSSSYSQFGKYNVLLISTSDKGCNDSALQEIEAASIPLPSFLIKPPQGCAGQTEFEFNSTSMNPDGRVMVYTWNFGDNTSLNSGAMAKHTYKFANNYGVKLTTASAICASEVIQNVSVVPGVNADFVVEKISPETRRFIALDTLTKGYTYFWNFGDGTTGYGAKATHMYKDNAPYNPVLVVFNSLDCSDTSDQNIDILSPNYKEQKNPLNFYVYPNPTTGSFVYKFEILEKRTVKVQIYDIVGQKPLFTREWTDMEPGTYYETVNLNEMNLSAGTYPFKITSQNDNLTLKIIYTGGE